MCDVTEIEEDEEDLSVREKCAFVSQPLPESALQAVGLSAKEAARLASPTCEEDSRSRDAIPIMRKTAFEYHEEAKQLWVSGEMFPGDMMTVATPGSAAKRKSSRSKTKRQLM